MQKLKLNLNTLFISAIVLTLNCERSNDCFSRTGKVILEERNVSDFNSISVNQDINLILTQDTFNKVSIEAGEGLQSGIKTDILNGTLSIANENICEWSRTYKKEITAYVTFKQLKELGNYTSGDISATDTLKLNNLTYLPGKANGNTLFNILCDQLIIKFTGGSGDVNISGKTAKLSISTYSSGRLNLLKLISDTVYIGALCPNDNYVYAGKLLNAVNNGTGNIYYSGHPQEKNITINSTGKVIQVNNQ